MKPAQEIEIKFAVPAELLPRLQQQFLTKAIRTAKPKSSSCRFISIPTSSTCVNMV